MGRHPELKHQIIVRLEQHVYHMMAQTTLENTMNVTINVEKPSHRLSFFPFRISFVKNTDILEGERWSLSALGAF